jgi:hypothetical protein
MASSPVARISFLCLALGGCFASGRAPLRDYDSLSQREGSWVKITGILRPGAMGPIVQATDFTLIAVGHRPFQPAEPGMPVELTGRLVRNTQRFESSTYLPFVLEDVRWKDMENAAMPQVMYIRPLDSGKLYADKNQR